MVVGISYEIRNLMIIVLGFLQLLKEENIYEKYNKYFYLMIEEFNCVNFIIIEFFLMGNIRKLDLQMLDLNLIICDIIFLIKIDMYN